MNPSQALSAAPASHSRASTSGVQTSSDGKNFESLGLCSTLLQTVETLGYTEPTPIQVRAIPEVLAGRDVLGLAQTGTGKTAAFLLPIINKLMLQESGKPRVLIVVPTRELAEQVLESARSLSKGTNLRSMSIYGGVRIDSQIRQLRQPMDIIVGCPGRILDLMEQRALSLSTIQYLVLDEADQMFDMGFIVPIRKLLKALPRERQSLLFSATMPPEISGLASEALQNPVKVQVATISSPVTVTHLGYPVLAHLKQKLLTHLLKTMSSESVLIFTRTKHKAKKLARYLEREGILATSLQGNLSQQQRMQAMKGFRTGKYSVMVATDIASRGIDVSSVTHVVNFDLPDTTEAYLHRTGRTGRAARNGDALSFITPGDEGEVRRFEKALRLPIKRTTVEGFDYAAKPEVEDSLGGYSHADRPRRESRGGSEGRFRGNRSGGSRGFSRGGRSEGSRSGGERSERRFDGQPREDRAASSSRPAGDRPYRSERSDRPARSDRPYRSERPQGNDRPARSFEGRGEGSAESRPSGESHGNRESANRSRPLDQQGGRSSGGRFGGRSRDNNRGGRFGNNRPHGSREDRGGRFGDNRPQGERAERSSSDRPARSPEEGSRSNSGERSHSGPRSRSGQGGARSQGGSGSRSGRPFRGGGGGSSSRGPNRFKRGSRPSSSRQDSPR